MIEPKWLDADALLVAHAEQQVRFGGLPGLRDKGAFESAVARPLNRFAYGEEDFIALAAAYAFGIARNHPFVDGNKRMALIAMESFLASNGVETKATQADAYAVFLRLAAGELDEDELARIVRERWL